MKKTLIILSFVLSTACAAIAQDGDAYIFHKLNVSSGLLDNTVYQTVQDKEGFVWMGTKNGLQRYDGNRFKNLRHIDGDSSSIPSNRVEKLLIDNQERIWLGTAGANIGYLDPHTFKFYKTSCRIGNNNFENLTGDLRLDENGRIIYHLRFNPGKLKGILYYDDTARQFREGDKRFQIPGNPEIENVSFNRLTQTWWMFTPAGLYRYSLLNRQMTTPTGKDSIDNINSDIGFVRGTSICFIDSRGILFFAHYQDGKKFRIYKYNPQTREKTDITKSLNPLAIGYIDVNSITEDGDHNIWIGGMNFLMKYSNKDQITIIPVKSETLNGINFDILFNIKKGNDNTLWISTTQGVYWFKPSAPRFRFIRNQLEGKAETLSEVTSIKQLKDNSIMVTTWGNSFFLYDTSMKPITNAMLTQGLKGNEGMIWDALIRKNGDVWRVQQEGWISIYHKDKNITEVLHDSIFRNRTIRQITEDSIGNIWFGSQSNDVYKYNTASKTITKFAGMPYMINKMMTDTHGDVWLAAGTICKIDVRKNSWVTYINAKDKQLLLSRLANDVTQYNDSLYLFSGEGLLIYNSRKQSYVKLGMQHGLPSDYVVNIEKDKNGLVWLSTENGISSLNVFNHRITTYGPKQGLSTPTYYPAASASLSDGRIIFGTSKGMVIFDPRAINKTRQVSEAVTITGIRLFQKDLLLDSINKNHELNLAHDENFLSFQFSNFSFPAIASGYYKMEGIDENWLAVGPLSEVTYSYMPPGNFRFLTGMLQRDGSIKTLDSLPISISNVFWKSWRFYLALILLAAVAAWYLYRQKINGLKKTYQVRSEIGKDLSKEVRVTLNNISVLSEIAVLKADKNLEQSIDYIHEIKQKSRNMVNALDDVMWSIDPANDSMIKIADRMNEIADIMRNEYNTNIELQGNGIDLSTNLSMKQRLEFILIYKRILLMFCRDSMAKTLDLEFLHTKQGLQLTASAPGTYLEVRQKKIDASIKEIKQRSAEVNANPLFVTDKNGSMVTVSFPTFDITKTRQKNQSIPI